MITRINESKTLRKNISCDWKCKFDGRKCNSDNGGIKVNVDVSVKNVMYKKKWKYLTSTRECTLSM